jgi:hypothetical protein
MISKRNMAGLSGSVIELSNYLEQRISQKSAEYAAVSSELLFKLSIHHINLFILFYGFISLLLHSMKSEKSFQLEMVLPVCMDSTRSKPERWWCSLQAYAAWH